MPVDGFLARRSKTWPRDEGTVESKRRSSVDMRYPGDTPFPADVRTDLNAFAARLTAASVMSFETHATWNLRHTLDEERKDEDTDDIFACSCGVDYLPMPVGSFIVRNAAEEYTRSSETQPPDVRYLRKIFSAIR